MEYNITEDERIVAQLGNRTKLLEETLCSHRLAISLNPQNTDVLFNTAQVLTSLAERILESGTQANGKFEARPLLDEAVEIFTKCLESQQYEYTQMQNAIAEAQASTKKQEGWNIEGVQVTDNQVDMGMETESNTSDAPGEWATIEEPLTPESILETCTAQLNALTTLLGLYTPTTDLSSIEKKAQDGMETANVKIPALIELVEQAPPKPTISEPQAGPTLSIGSTTTAEEPETSPKDDTVLAVANFKASIAELKYRSGSSTFAHYAQTVEEVFSALIQSVSTPDPSTLAAVNAQSAYADALIDLASALADNIEYPFSSSTLASDIEVQWQALTQAQTILTKLSSAPHTSILSAARLASIFLARGDTDLFRFRIAVFENAKPAWKKSTVVLIANAGVFYRGARSYAEKAGSSELQHMADTKAVVAEILKEVASGSTMVNEAWKTRAVDMAKVLEQMVEEGVVGRENVEGVLKVVE